MDTQTDETTIDDLIEHFKKSERTNKDWNFVVSMTAQLDHNVHLTRLSDPFITEILENDDKLMRKLFENLPYDTTLIITSDHGLIEKGHGGSSPEEKLATLIVYRKSGFPLMKLDNDSKNELKEILEQKVDGVDLTIMLSMLGGHTPPINSLGNYVNSMLF